MPKIQQTQFLKPDLRWCVLSDDGEEITGPMREVDAKRYLDLLEALAPLAALKVPRKPHYNAGAYSIRHEDIERARALLAKHRTEK